MTPEDARHGSNAGYGAGCRQDCCRVAHAAYRRSVWRKRYVKGVDRLYVDATGTKRRIRALQAIGYRLIDIDHAAGYNPRNASVTWSHNVLTQEKVHVDKATLVAKVYDELSMKIPTGPSVERCRKYAATRGWLPPLSWDDATIDDPKAKPYRPRKRDRDKAGTVDQVLVQRALAGQKVDANTREKEAITKAWLKAGKPLTQLEALQGWNVWNIKKRSA